MPNRLNSRPILTYDEVAAAASSENHEPLVDVRTYDQSITAKYAKSDMIPVAGETIYVRDAVARKLAEANKQLQPRGYHLHLVYGWRHPDVQQKYFDVRRAQIKLEHPDVSDADLDRMTHPFIAVPSVGGHPTGGAVDIAIHDASNQQIDFGTVIADFTDPVKIQTDAPNLSKTQIANRKLLHDTLVSQGFAPFYGEWWHFSYGDREWAVFFDRPSSLYEPIREQKVGK